MRTRLGATLGLAGMFVAFIAANSPANAAFKLTIADTAVAGAKAAVTDESTAGSASDVTGSIGTPGKATPKSGDPLEMVGGSAGTAAFLRLSGGAGSTDGDAANWIITLSNADLAGTSADPRLLDPGFAASRPHAFASKTADLFSDDGEADFASDVTPAATSPATARTDLPVPGETVVALADPFSKSMDLLIAQDAAGAASSEETTRIAPIPGSLVLFGSALLGLVLTGRFSRRANATA